MDSRRLTISCIVDVTIHVIHEIALAGIAQSAAPEDIIIQPYEKTYQRQVARLSGMVEEKEKISIPVGMPAADVPRLVERFYRCLVYTSSVAEYAQNIWRVKTNFAF